MSGLAKQSVNEEPATHADLTMNSPHGKMNPTSFQCLAPCEYVLINAVDERSVKVEEEGLSILALHHCIPPWPSQRQILMPALGNNQFASDRRTSCLLSISLNCVNPACVISWSMRSSVLSFIERESERDDLKIHARRRSQ